jgi:hypothetical protein
VVNTILFMADPFCNRPVFVAARILWQTGFCDSPVRPWRAFIKIFTPVDDQADTDCLVSSLLVTGRVMTGSRVLASL